jgi:hypothetical protein
LTGRNDDDSYRASRRFARSATGFATLLADTLEPFFDEIDRNGLLAAKAVSGTRLATVAYVMKHCRSRGIGGCRARNRYLAPRSVVGDGSQLADGTSDAWRSTRLADDMQVPATTAL